ncbi:hypothetical protein [Endozoicomonas sp. ALB091]|uniref:hypothetical protein n=2 Tax=unclassified Endozoicomonas TaxID=2644528 RepID=UPI003BB48DEC
MNKCSQEFLSLADECLHQFAQTESDEFSSILTSDDLNSFQNCYPGCRVRDFPPIKTLILFMRQVASDTKSCRHALIDEARDQVVKGNKNKVPNTDTSAYCKARQRLSEVSVRGLLRISGNSLDHASPESWLWHQRRVLLTDDSTLLMPDTEKNQKEYPQPGTQKKGLVSRFSEFLF